MAWSTGLMSGWELPWERSRVKVKKDIHKNNVGRARIEPATSRVLAAVRQMRLGRFTLNQVALSVLIEFLSPEPSSRRANQLHTEIASLDLEIRKREERDRIEITATALQSSNPPGDYLHHDDDEVEGFKTRLNERLAPVGSQFSGEGVNDDWEIGDTLAQWWRPNFETFMYPFLPGHVTRPKECKKLYFIQLPKKKVLSVPKNMKLLAVPLFELYDNTARYGPQLSAIPHLLSRYNFEFVDENDNVVAVTPGEQPGPDSSGGMPQAKVLLSGEDGAMGEDNKNGVGDQEGEMGMEGVEGQ
ncbi:cleavage and polyadenylation specific factor 5 [Histoplasma capsulatum G186AR]|uniref:Cleavage and polyadenylation specific factor 5 n=1 Tax=Ajellomyces capsulatus (strain G186AR / H82 / ATCC MYA-2454 / RMSCC 2432) TaxID=447093 RepID=C0NT49_AJECG|nr:cleavage and polyadenylation specific factor 5 [Histoplasma capsulatum G186AR]EEH05210.1 cleavage and polyadenylation specific factor 5 [Histoplasma capsulatum G186AR]